MTLDRPLTLSGHCPLQGVRLSPLGAPSCPALFLPSALQDSSYCFGLFSRAGCQTPSPAG